MALSNSRRALGAYLSVIKLQVCLGGLAIIASLGISRNLIAVISALCGFGLAFMPTLIYAKIAATKQVLMADKVLALHKKALIFKFSANFLGFLIVFITFRQVNSLALFGSYLLTLSSYWLGLLLWPAQKC